MLQRLHLSPKEDRGSLYCALGLGCDESARVSQWMGPLACATPVVVVAQGRRQAVATVLPQLRPGRAPQAVVSPCWHQGSFSHRLAHGG